jgi:predicted lipoprotein with Yx(FWY)xxD motif
MAFRSLARHAAVVAVGVAALAACGNQAPAPAPPPAPALAPPAAAVVPTPPADAQQAPPDGSQFGQVIGTDAPQRVRVQGRVEIFDGATTVKIDGPVNYEANKIQLQAVVNGQVGLYVTDSEGRTLYRFDEDTANPSKSNCTSGQCAETWPALLVKSPGDIYTVGVDASEVGYVERPDGTCQVTVAGWPVYYFSGDQKPGDIKGQNFGGTWFTVNPEGGETDAVPHSAGGARSSGGGQSAGEPQSSNGYSGSGQQNSNGGSGGY